LGGIGKKLECNNIDSYRRKGSLLIQTLYLWDRDRGRRKNRNEIKNKAKKIGDTL